MTSQFIKQSLFTATVITIAGNVIGRLLGFAREAYFASYFGTSEIFDVFIVAFTIPELFGMILFSAMPMALIPLIKSDNTVDKIEESRCFWSGLIWFGIGFGLLSVLFFIFRQELIFWLAPNLSAEMANLASELSGVLSVFIFLRGLEIYFRSWCFLKMNFLAPALSTIIVNLIIIGSIVLLFDRFQIKALAYGWVADGVALLLFNGYFAFKVVKPKFNFRIDPVWVAALTRSLVAVTIIECISMSYALVDRYFAGHYLGAGPISALRYASTLVSIPSGVFVAAFNVASFPWIAEHLQNNKIEELRNLYSKTVRALLFFLGFAAIGIMIFASDIVRLALGRGKFDAASLALTTTPMMIYAIGITFVAVYTFQMRFYFAGRQLLRLGVILSVMLALKLILSFFLVQQFSHEGLAWATVGASVVGFLIMTVDIGKKLKFELTSEVTSFIFKSLAVLASIAVIWIGLKFLWPSTQFDSSGLLFVRLFIFALLGLVMLFIIGNLFKHPESRMALELLRAKFTKRR